jgi:secondary thiamine-phosphate synthase enzyme
MTSGKFSVSTHARMSLVNITPQIDKIVQMQATYSGILYLFNPHTTAGLTINEGADPDVCTDIIKGLQNIVPDHLNYRHMEGNSPAHIMTLLTGSSLTVHIENSHLLLGTWQQIFFCEYDGPRNRSIHWKILADR